MAGDDFVMGEHSDASSQSSLEEIQKLLEWLVPTEYATDGSEYQKHIRAHMPGTGNWIFETEQYKKWFESEEIQTLWIKGIPGSGKSVMAANLIKKLSEESKSTVLFFFFRNIIEVNSKPISLVRDFLAQLLPNSHQLVSILKRLMLKFPEVGSTPLHELWGALITALSTIERAFIVVDALDEIEVFHKSFIPDTLLTLGLPEHKSVKLVVTSRPLSIFESPSENSYTAVLRLSPAVMDQDISTYISQRLESQQQRELRYDEKNAIMNHVFQQQHRLFLQARVMLDDLLQREEPVESLLGQPAYSMSHMYQNILHEYSIRAGVLRDLQVQVLQWVTHTSRPLRLLELSELLCSQGLFPDIHKAKAVVRICCGPLLEVLDNETISIIHHSFTELLLDSSRLTDNSPEAFPVLSPTTTHATLAAACIDYALKAFESYDNTNIWSIDQRKKDHMLQFPFLQYAVHQWPYHFSKASDTENEILQQAELFKKVDTLLESESKQRKTWLDFCPDGLRKGLIGGAAIHIGSFLGLTRYVEYLLQRGIDPNLKASDESTPIICAASQGHSRVIAVIVKYGGNVDAVDCFGLTPLHHAAIYDHATAIATLADCGATLLPRKINADRGQMINHTYHDPFPRQDVQRLSALWGASPQEDTLLGHTPIKFACEYGCSSSVAILMKYMTTEQRATVCLHWAAARGHSEIISILLQYPEVVCRINEIDENGNTALILASRDINPDVVRVLLQAGASISPVSSNLKERDSYIQLGQKRRRTNVTIGITPLNAWAELSRNMSPRDESALLDDMEKVAKILVQAGCDVDVRSAEGYTPLFNWNKNFQTLSVTTKFVSILIDHGADPRAKAECGSTPLHLMNGKEEEHEAILLLIKAGADINAVRSSDGKTPMLNYASIAHDVPDVTRFIQYGVDFSKTDNDGNTALHYLMKKSSSNHPIGGWFDVCDPRVINKLGETCLFSVCHQWPGWGVEKVITEVISRGVNLETKNILGRTALLETCCEGGNEHIKAFLTVGADTAARDNHGSTCLHLLLANQSSNLSARSRSDKEFLQIFEELLSAGADPNTVDFSGNHLIHSAIWLHRLSLGSSDPIHALTAAVEFGNDVTAVNSLGQTALHLAMTKRFDSSMEAKSVDIQRLDFLLGTKLMYSLSAKDHNGLTPAHLAAASSETMLSRLIYAGAYIQATDSRDRLPLHLAAGNLSNTTGLLCQIYRKNSWDVDQTDLQGRTPLHEAASTGNFEAVKFLLRSGANPSKTDKLNRSPLHAAVTFIRARRIARLERDFYNRDRQRGTLSQNPLYLGSSTKLQRPLGLWLEDELDQRNAQDVVHALLEAGSDPCLVDYLGYTAYDLALVNDNENVAHLLLSPHGVQRTTGLTGPVRLPTDLARQWLSPDARIITEIVNSMPLGKTEQYEYLETAVYLGNTLLLETLLRSGIDLSVSGMTNAGFTIVHACVCAGQISMMKTLAPYIEDINCFFPPLLHLAVEREGSNLEMIKLLLELGANPDTMYPSHVPTRQERQDYDNVFRNGKFPSIGNCHTVLHRLAAGRCWWHNEAIDLVVAKSVDLEATNSDGMTALHLALSGKNHGFWRNQCLDVLLSCGADVNKVHEKSGLTSLNMALEGNCGMEIVQKLIKHGADIGTGPNPPLISAIGGVDLPGVKLLLDAGADPNGTYGTEKRLPLQIAADAWTENEGYLDGLPDIIKLLLEAGSDPLAEVTAHWFDTTRMFHYFCYKNAPIQPFIDFGVDIETRDQSGRTGLHTACLYFGYIDQGGMPSWVANELIASDAELDVTDESGNTPLICTMQTDSDLWEVFNSLVQNGASVTIQNLEGRTVLNYALEHNEYEIHQKVYLVRSLMEKGADPKVGLNDAGATNLHTLAAMLASCVPYEGDKDIGNYEDIEKFYQQFLELGCDPEAQDENGNTPAFYYVKTSELSATYNQKSEPLSLAHWKTYLEKIDVKAVNQDGDNLLHVVADRQERRNIDDGVDVERLFKLLMDLGADPKAENNAGVSPLDIAATCGKTGILEMFKRETI